MPPSELSKVVSRFRAALLAQDAATARLLIDSYGNIYLRLSSEIDAILETAARRELTIGQVKRLERFQALQAQVLSEMHRYSAFAGETITIGQRSASGLAQGHVQALVDTALPPGINRGVLARAGIVWNTLPADAFEMFIGIAGDGSPLARLLDTIGPEARVGMTEAIGQGISQGLGPRRTAALVRDRLGMGLTRSLAFARTETLRAYRESSRLQYASNPNVVKGYRRHCERGPRTCMACIALDGKFYETEVPLNEHVNGRCAMVPETVSYKDLGLSTEDRRPQDPDAREWFKEQPRLIQRSMMGPSKFEVWEAGDIQLEDLAKVEQNPIWGEQAVVTPLKDLVG